MPQGRNRVLRHLRRLMREVSGVSRTDRQLLEEFVSTRDETSFALLVRRHARLVMSTCRRILHNEQDAEDAFQAVFLVLARKAARVAWQDSITTWLYQVACRVAWNARARRCRQRAHQSPGRAEEPTESLSGITLGELQQVLDEELHRLPTYLQAPLQLCYLQGMTQDEAARALGWSEGTLRGRLHRARTLLRQRLARRGLSVPAVLLAAALTQSSAPGAVSGPLIGATVQAAVCFASGQTLVGLVSSTTWTLTQEVLQAMFWAKFQMTAAGILMIGLLAMGMGWLSHVGTAAGQPQSATVTNPLGGEQLKPVRPQDEHRFQQPHGLRGKIAALDTTRSPASITVEVDEQEQVRVSLDLAQDARVSVAGLPATLGSLRIGAKVVLVLATDNRTVTAVEARGRRIDCLLVKVDVNANTLTVRDDDDDDNPQFTTVSIAKDTPIYIDGYRGRLVDLEDCKELKLELAADEKSVARILAQWSQEDDPEGRIIQIDPARGELTVRVEEEDDRVNDFKVKITADSKLFVNGQPAKLTDLQVGWKATLRGKGDTVQTMRVVKRALTENDDDD